METLVTFPSKKDNIYKGDLSLVGDKLHNVLHHGRGGEIQELVEKILGQLSIWSTSSVAKEENCFTAMLFSVLDFAHFSTSHQDYIYHTEREAGLGRADIICIPGSGGSSGVVIKLKNNKNGTTDDALG